MTAMQQGPAHTGLIWAPAQAVNNGGAAKATRTSISEGYLVLIPRLRRPTVAIAMHGELFVTAVRQQEFAPVFAKRS
jgi:hypothetical protein